ncbi:RTA1 domain containing protein [Colletotrichum tofieldiae]|nr:RTA1 domain containing protein [Colletotrichum tofieldiae]GKT77342.1 RTA1 domain containing protein [Colletotrichum tofieldiae]GKT86265.1 RTA1 domain containing protein [Colletotrichum tofieldiae]
MARPETSIWPYDPSFPLAVVGAVLYGIVFVWIFYLTVIRYRAWYFTVVVVGATFEVSAYVLRAYSARNQTEITPFVQTTTYTVLAPVLIAAGNYLLIGRLIRAVLPASHHTIYRVPARRLTRIFVGCDVVAFCIQGAGSGVASGGSWTGTLKEVGTKILIAGLVVQVFCFGVYLVVEFAEGMDGYAFRNEWLFWAFEALPMLIAIAVFCVWHPSKYLGRDDTKGGSVKGSERFRMEEGSGRDTVTSRGQSV